MNFKQYAKDAIEFSKGLFAIDSPTGFTEKVTEHVLETAKSMDTLHIVTTLETL